MEKNLRVRTAAMKEFYAVRTPEMHRIAGASERGVSLRLTRAHRPLGQGVVTVNLSGANSFADFHGGGSASPKSDPRIPFRVHR